MASKSSEKSHIANGRLTGFLFLLTFLSSIPPVFLFYYNAINDRAFILVSEASNGVSWGAVLELILIFSNIATSLTLYPVLKNRFPVASLGYVACRLVECGFIAVGIVALLALDTLRVGVKGGDPETLMVVGQALVAIHDWTFRLGPGVVVGVGNGLTLGLMMWNTRLVPRQVSILGIVGGPILTFAGILVIFGQIQSGGSIQALCTIPEFLWELILGVWLILRGFSSSDIERRR